MPACSKDVKATTHTNATDNPAPLTVKGLQIDFPVLLAPLAGITDYPFRKIALSFGAGLAVTEMLASQAMIRNNRKSLLMTSSIQNERVLAQISGSDSEIMAETARMLENQGALGIDINMGCPQPKVIKTNAGAALMKDERLAGRIMEAVRRAVSIPVSVKMRLGWDETHMNAQRIAIIAQENGIDFITIHARTRSQMFGGKARWECIRPIKEALKIPVIANGDIIDGNSAKECLRLSGADGLMIGRAALGKPWIFSKIKACFKGQIQGSTLDIKEQFPVILNHIQDILDFYGMPTAIYMARKHLSWYSKGLRSGAAFRDRINRLEDWKEIIKTVTAFYDGLEVPDE
ncbi:MAG: tRNA dihydrouridine synthase DusB [Dissulfuribacterales bacterium]